jgi:hypothetical protein
VVTNPSDDLVGAESGAVYLFSGRTGALLGDLVGSSSHDRVGDAGARDLGSGPGTHSPNAGPPQGRVSSGGVTALANGNYVVASPYWNDNRGAATWADGTAGVSGAVDAGNSLVGTSPGDYVGGNWFGESGVRALSNGNYVVESPQWNGIRGAATWGDGTVGITGAVDAGNSLVGTAPGDSVGGSQSEGVPFLTALANGNYVVSSPDWHNLRGAVTWGNGAAGVRGPVDDTNSLVGRASGQDRLGGSVTALSNGNYVVSSPLGVTWGDGTAGITGTPDASNSLVGGSAGVQPSVTVLANGNYVVTNLGWNGGRGAATWGDGTSGVRGTIDASNSLVGSNPNDLVGSGVTALANGNYVVRSPFWNGLRGAMTWGDGAAGVRGTVGASNSLVGSNAGDEVGYGANGYTGVTALANGNYVIQSPNWNGNRGAVTWGDGTTGVRGPVSAANSLVGSSPGDRVGGSQLRGGGGVTALVNGNYVVQSPDWNGNRGAATWGDGTAGVTGAVDASNSLVGSNTGDHVAFATNNFDGVKALSNGSYVVRSPQWDGTRGAVTWGDGRAGVTGTVDASNSLVGSDPGDQVGSGLYGLTPLSNGNYVVTTPSWNGNRGAVTWGDGTAGVTGAVGAGNSLVGTNPNDFVGGFDGVTGTYVTALANGNYVVQSPGWNGNRGAVTWGDGRAGVTGPVAAANSLVGSSPDDLVGGGPYGFVTALANGNYVVVSAGWNGSRGAVTWGDGTAGVTGTVDASNSLVGSNTGDMVGFAYPGVTALSNGNYVVASPNWNGGRGAATWGDGTAGVTGAVDASNSLVGSNPGDQVGGGVNDAVTALANGNYVVVSPDWDGGRGAATWADGTVGITGPVDPSNSLVG